MQIAKRRRCITDAMEKHGFKDDVICQLEEIENTVKTSSGRKRMFAEKMDELLTEEQRLLLWEYGGMCTGGETGKRAKKYAKTLAGSLAEKIAHLNEDDRFYKIELNDDETITAYCGCHCLQYRIDKPDKEDVKLRESILSAYGCAAGAAFHNIKMALGINARIKSIDYPKKGDGRKYMPFVIEVID